jgi:hypothetical protein
VVLCPHIVTCCDCRSHWWTPGCKEIWTWSTGQFSVKWMILPLENSDRMYSLERIQNCDWDTDTDSICYENQGTCWDAEDTLGWGKAPGIAETSAPWTSSMWKDSPCHDTLKEQVGCHPPASPIGLYSPTKPLSFSLPGPQPQASLATACQFTRLMPHRPICTSPWWMALVLPHASSKPT